ncbi:MAG: hypothetical protein WKF89_16790, partial [Chitinophagaceae bacterium]
MNKKLIGLFVSGFIGLAIAFALNQRSLRELKSERETVYRVQAVIVLFHKFSRSFNSAQIYTPALDTLPNTKMTRFYYSDIKSVF